MSQFNVQQDEDLTLSASTLLALSEFALENGLMVEAEEGQDVRKQIELEVNKGCNDLVSYDYHYTIRKECPLSEDMHSEYPFLACFSAEEAGLPETVDIELTCIGKEFGQTLNSSWGG